MNTWWLKAINLELHYRKVLALRQRETYLQTLKQEKQDSQGRHLKPWKAIKYRYN